MSNRVFTAGCLLGAFLLGAVVGAQEPEQLVSQIVIMGESAPLARRLQVADQLTQPEFRRDDVLAAFGALLSPRSLAPFEAVIGLSLHQLGQQKWPEALDDYLRLHADAGDHLALLPWDKSSSVTRSVRIRRLVDERLAGAPPSMLARYRQHVDAAAKKLYDEGREALSSTTLRRLVDDYFASPWGESALDMLGDLSFERGDFDEALAWWRRLAAPPSEAGAVRQTAGNFSGLSGDFARIRAKQVLGYHFAGRDFRAREELAAFRALHPKAAGKLAGREGVYAATLERVLAAGPVREADSWTTFAGAARRHTHLAAIPASLFLQGPAWRVRLLDENHGRELSPSEVAMRLAFHPVILSDRVLVADAGSITAYDIRSGKRLFRYECKEAGAVSDSRARYSLTVDENRIYARMGTSAIGPRKDPGKIANYLICLEMLRPGAKEEAFREAWKVAVADLGGAASYLEGPPVVHDGRVYAAVSRVSGKNTQSLIVCLDAATGARRWIQEVCEAPEFQEQTDVRHQSLLLTLAGVHVIYCTHTGAIVALDRFTGAKCWAIRYPARSADSLDPWPREANPCFYHDRRVIAAPRDSNRLFCLDVFSGRLLWEREGVDVVHLLGVASGRFIFTTPRGVQAIDLATGLDRGGWSQPADGALPPLGRGLLAGGKLYWPTRDAHLPLRVLHLGDGTLEDADPSRFHRFRPGNLAYAHGCLVVAGLNELTAYRIPAKTR